MNPDADPDGLQLYDRLEAELNAMINSGVANPEAWFRASFSVDVARSYDAFGMTAEGALDWCTTLRADRAATAAWAKMGMDPVDPFQVLEAIAVGLLPTSWQRWRLAGLSHEITVDWVDRRFSRDDALAWIESGLPYPAQAAEWTARSFGPAAAKRWRVAIREVADFASGWVEVGFTPEESALCRLVGVDRPPALEDRVPGDLTAAIEAGRIELGRHPWAVNYRRPR